MKETLQTSSTLFRANIGGPRCPLDDLLMTSWYFRALVGRIYEVDLNISLEVIFLLDYAGSSDKTDSEVRSFVSNLVMTETVSSEKDQMPR